MVGIIFIVLFALFACLNGDSSGVEAIAKIIGGIILFVVVGSIIVFMMDNPAIIIAIIVVVFLIVVVYSLTKENNSKSTNNTYQEPEITTTNTQINNYKNDTVPISDFQKELQQNTNTPQQVQAIKEKEETKEIYDCAKIHYELIKHEIINQAKSGNYTFINGIKVITYDYKYRHKPHFIGRRKEPVFINKTLFNPTGQYAYKLTMFITDQNYYNKYISAIKEMLNNDNISIEPLIINKKNTNEIHSLPFTIQGFGISEFDYEFILRCRVRY